MHTPCSKQLDPRNAHVLDLKNAHVRLHQHVMSFLPMSSHPTLPWRCRQCQCAPAPCGWSWWWWSGAPPCPPPCPRGGAPCRRDRRHVRRSVCTHMPHTVWQCQSKCLRNCSTDSQTEGSAHVSEARGRVSVALVTGRLGLLPQVLQAQKAYSGKTACCTTKRHSVSTPQNFLGRHNPLPTRKTCSSKALEAFRARQPSKPKSLLYSCRLATWSHTPSPNQLYLTFL